MTDPRVEEIRARLATRLFYIIEGDDIRYLLTKLDEAEQERDAAYLIGMAQVSRRATAAEERERTLIAGVRELHDYMSEPTGKNTFYVNGFASRYDSLRELYGDELPDRIEAILSRLLPSTPTEEGKTDAE